MMKKILFWITILNFSLTNLQAQTEVGDLIVNKSAYADTLKFVIENPEVGDIMIHYIVIQDIILELTEGETLIPGQDSVIIKVQSDSIAYHSYELDLSEGSSSMVSGFEGNHTRAYGKPKLGTGIRVFPNPVRDLLTIDLATAFSSATKVCLYNLSGQQVIEGWYDPIEQITLFTGGLSPGIYVLRLENEQRVEQKQIVISGTTRP